VPIVWSRLYIAGGRLHLDIGRGSAVRLPDEETERRWRLTNPEWPIMHMVLRSLTLSASPCTCAETCRYSRDRCGLNWFLPSG
jgi:hypothetical protein